MRRNIFLTTVVVALCSSFVTAQDNGEQLIKKALIDREVLLKMDLPAVDTGITMTFDDAKVSFDKANYERLLKEYGPALSKDTRARITDVRVSRHGIEIDLNGGGLPEHDWMVGGFRLETPTPLPKSNREVTLERLIQSESNFSNLSSLRSQLDSERSARVAQDSQNQAEFDRISLLRSEYIETNRKNWGSKIIVLIRSRRSGVKMSDMVQSLAKYIVLLPREPASQ
jgi:hypothetical protein